MSEEPKRVGWGTGCMIAGAIAAVLMILVLGAGAVGMIFYLKQRPSAEDMVLPSPPATAPATIGEGGGEDDAVPPEGDDDGCVAALPVLVKLAGVTDKGEVRYLLDGQEEAVGDAALIAALKKRAAEDEADPDDDVQVIVDLDVATAAGITQAQVEAAVKACWAGGASVLPPPDISKESAK